MKILNGRPLRVFAADDSAVMRGIMHKLFAQHQAPGVGELPRMELCGVARDGAECLEEVKRLAPDVLVLDLEMPRLNGLEVLDRLRVQNPGLPVIMCSAHTEHGARSTLEALARGAADYVMKPGGQRDVDAAIRSLALQLLPKIAALATSGRTKRADKRQATPPRPRTVELQGGAPIDLVVIGLSTGGPSALEQMLPKLPADFPVPILIVQHMPKLFTGALAERLNKGCALRVQEAFEGAMVRPGVILIAPGDAHMEIAPRKTMLGDPANGARIRLHRQAPLNHCMPAVDYLFFSAARMYGAGVLALVMTGMGSDGLDGARAIYERGGTVLAQDEASSAVWGMPGRVVEAGIAATTLPVTAIAEALQQRVSAGRAARPIATQHAAAALETRREVVHGMY